MNPKVSVIIVNWNTKDYLKNCLRSIQENVRNITYEVFVVDNNSSDGSADMVRNDFPEVKLIVNTTNLGFAKANNLAIPLSKGEYVLILNPDTIVFPEAIESMVKFMDEHPRAGACGPKLLDSKGRAIYPDAYLPTLKEGFVRNTILVKIFPKMFINSRVKQFDCNKLQKVERLCGCCMLVRKKTIEEVGLLEEKMFLFYEDPDWCLRIRRNWDIYYFPQAEIIHYVGQSIRQVERLEVYLHGYQSQYLFYRKRYGLIPTLSLRIFVAISSLLGLLYWIVISLIKQKEMKYYEKISFYKALIKVSLGI